MVYDPHISGPAVEGPGRAGLGRAEPPPDQPNPVLCSSGTLSPLPLSFTFQIAHCMAAMNLFVQNSDDLYNQCLVSENTYRAMGLSLGAGALSRAVGLLAGKLRRTTVCIIAYDPKQSLPDGAIYMNKAVRTTLRVYLGDTVRFVAEVQDLPDGTVVEFAPMVDITKPQFAVDTLRRDYLQPYLTSSGGGVPVKVGDVLYVPHGGSASASGSVVRFKVVRVVALPVNPPHTCWLNAGVTEVRVTDDAIDPNKVSAEDVGYDTIGGMRTQLAQIREMVELPLRYPELFTALGVVPPRGVLMFGPPGTGKTLIARAVANESGAYFKLINGPEIMAGGPGESEANLRKAFEEAAANTPAIIFIDEVDSIAPSREKGGSGEVERRVVAQLLTLLDGMKAREQVIVIGATNRPNAIDPALRRYGRFDREIEIGVPNKEGRLEIFGIHSRGMRLNDDVNADVIAEKTHGFVGADIASLCTEAGMVRVRKEMGLFDLGVDTIGADTLTTATVNMSDFEAALAKANPASLREALVQKPDVSWASIGGNTALLRELQEMIKFPVKHPQLYEHFRQTVPKGVLMYGPPGCGKTMIAKALATEADANFLSVKGPELLTKWFGESEANVRELFDKARAAAPCILFFDEFDSIAKKRYVSATAAVCLFARYICTVLNVFVCVCVLLQRCVGDRRRQQRGGAGGERAAYGNGRHWRKQKRVCDCRHQQAGAGVGPGHCATRAPGPVGVRGFADIPGAAINLGQNVAEHTKGFRIRVQSKPSCAGNQALDGCGLGWTVSSRHQDCHCKRH